MAINSEAITREGLLDTGTNEARLEGGGNSGALQIFISQSDYTNRTVSNGIPFAYGDVYTTNELMLKDENGIEVDAQYDVLAFWPDNSFRSVLVTANVAGSSTADKTFSLDYGSGVVQSVYTSNMSLTDNAGDYTIENGSIKVVIDKNTASAIKSIHADVNNDDSYSQQLCGQVHYEAECALTGNIYSTQYDTSPTLTVHANGINMVEIEVECRLETSGGTQGPKLISYYKIFTPYASNSESVVDVQHSIIDDELDTRGNVSFFQNNVWTPSVPVDYSIRRLELNFPVDSSMTDLIMGGEATEGASTLEVELDRAGGDSATIRQTGIWKMNQHGILSSDPNETGDTRPAGYYFTTDGTGVAESYSGALDGERCRGYCQLSTTASTYGICVMPRNFWQKYPMSIEANTAGIKFKMYDQMDSPTHETTYDWSDGFFGPPQSLYNPIHGMSNTNAYRIVCNHTARTSVDTLSNMYFNYQTYLPDIRASRDQYCTSKAYVDSAPTNQYTQLLEDGVLNRKFRHTDRALDAGGKGEFLKLYGWRHFGDRCRSIESGFTYLGDRMPYMKMGTHIGGCVWIAQWMKDGIYDWLEYGAKETEYFADRAITWSEVANHQGYNLLPSPVPKGQVRIPKHKVLDAYSPAAHFGHQHDSGLIFMYMLTGNRWYYRSMETLAEFLGWITVQRYPLPRPTEVGIKVGDPGKLPPSSESRNHGWNLLNIIDWVKISNDRDYFITNVCHAAKFWIQWWKALDDIVINYEVVGQYDYLNGTGFWPSTIPGGMDNAPSNSSNSTIPWTDVSMLIAIMEFHDMEEQYQTGEVDLTEVRMMCYQVIKHIVEYGYDETIQSFHHAVSANPQVWPGASPYPSEASALLLAGPIAKALVWYAQDVASGVLSETEQSWFDPEYYRLIITRHIEKQMTVEQSLDSFFSGGYEVPYPAYINRYYDTMVNLQF